MPDGSTQPSERLSPARIRKIIVTEFEEATGWLTGIVNSDTPIEEKHLELILARVSKRTGLNVTLLGNRPKRGWKFTIASFITHVFDNQGSFKPLPPEQPEEPTPNPNP